MVYNWHADNWYRRSAKCFDAKTGEEVRLVWYYNTKTKELVRYLPSTVNGKPYQEKPGKMAQVVETRELRIEWADKWVTLEQA